VTRLLGEWEGRAERALAGLDRLADGWLAQAHRWLGKGVPCMAAIHDVSWRRNCAL
jgi:hypothetical protein